MEIPPDYGGMDTEGLRGALLPADPTPLSRTHLLRTHQAEARREAEMDTKDADDKILENMHALLSNTRSQLAQAVEEANQLQAWSSDEEGADNQPSGTVRVEEPDAEALAKMSNKEREAAIKRARNREAARRSRQRKNERINQLCRDIKTLQQENIVLLKCIEDFTKKAMNAKEHQLQMKEQLAALGTTTGVGGVDTTSLLDHYQDDTMLLPMEVDDLPMATAAAAATTASELDGAAHGPSSASILLTVPQRASLVAGLSLPSLAELQKLQNTEAAGGSGGQLTARGGTLSARGAAVAEHIAMLSKENSPRDDEIGHVNGTGPAAAGVEIGEPSFLANEKQQQVVMTANVNTNVNVPPVGQFFAAEAGAPPAIVPDGGTVDINLLFGAWNGSDRK